MDIHIYINITFLPLTKYQFIVCQQYTCHSFICVSEHRSLFVSQRLFEEQLKKYDQVKLYIDQNLAAQENILKALTEANVQSATARKSLTETEHK